MEGEKREVTALQNIIFDMGNVLINYDPVHFVEREGIADAADRELLLNTIFRAEGWAKLDSGEMVEAELESQVLPALPARLHAAAHRLIFAWERRIEAIPGMEALIQECKGRGLGVYLLSNASLRQPEYWKDVPCSRFFDGAVVSACERCVKPDPEIYRRLLDRYGLEAGECVFVDDVQANVDGAVAAGMCGIRFEGSAEKLREALFS